MSQDRKEVKEQVLWTFGGRAFRLREQQVQRPSGGRGPGVWEEAWPEQRGADGREAIKAARSPGREPANSPGVTCGPTAMALVYTLSMEASKSQQQAK